MARKGNLKKKPKGVVEVPTESQESQKKISFEVRGKKGSRWENQVDIPGHVLDRAFLVRVNSYWNDWQHQLMAVPATPLWYNYPQPTRNYLSDLGKLSTASMMKGPKAFFTCKAFFASASLGRYYHPYYSAIAHVGKLRPRGLICHGPGPMASN